MKRAPELDWLYALQHFGIKLGLHNIRELLSRLGNPQRGLACVHIAGTNGKGSVSLLLSEICRHAGYRVGLYTSPHLHCFTERIRIDGTPLAAAELPGLLAEVREAAAGMAVTFFEAATALGFLAMRRAGVELAVIETGMGGRLDATNVVEPLLCCITPVGLDHQEHLGATLAAIAAEKAGIIKTGVPVVLAPQAEAAGEVLAAAAASRKAALWQGGRDYRWGGSHAAMWFVAPGCALDGLCCALAGDHQLDNLAQAIAAAVQLRRLGMVIPDRAICAAAASAHWPGRLEWFGEPPHILLDGAHNRLGAERLADYLAGRGGRPVHLVAALSGQRDPEQVLTPLLPHLKALYATPLPEVTTVPVVSLVDWGARHARPAQGCATPAAALNMALAARAEDEFVVAAGSLYLVGAIRGLLLENRIHRPPLGPVGPELAGSER